MTYRYPIPPKIPCPLCEESHINQDHLIRHLLENHSILTILRKYTDYWMWYVREDNLKLENKK